MVLLYRCRIMIMVSTVLLDDEKQGRNVLGGSCLYTSLLLFLAYYAVNFMNNNNNI